MKVLLDENVPQPLHAILSHLLRGHIVEHVGLTHWRSTYRSCGMPDACGALCAAMRGVVAALEAAPAQRIVRVEGLGARKRRFRVTDPQREPPSAYWR